MAILCHMDLFYSMPTVCHSIGNYMKNKMVFTTMMDGESQKMVNFLLPKNLGLVECVHLVRNLC